MKTAYPIGLVVSALAIGGFVPVPCSAGAAKSFDSVQGGYSVLTTGKVQGLKKFPKVEAFTPLPSNYQPGRQAEVFLLCETEVGKMGEPVADAVGSFRTELVVLDRSSGRFDSFEVGTEAVRVAKDGYGAFFLDIAMEPFVERLQSDEVSAWLRTHGSFATKRGNSLVLVCMAFSPN